MIPDKLIAKLQDEYTPPLPPERVAVHIQKELNELLEYIEVFARRGQFSESFRYPNEVLNLSSEVDLLVRELLFMGFGVQIKGECLDVQWRYPEHGTRAHGFRKEAETAFVVLVLDEFDSIDPSVNPNPRSITVGNRGIYALEEPDLAIWAKLLVDVGFYVDIRYDPKGVEVTWED